MRDVQTLRSSIYTGFVTHSRLRPKKHTFKYRVFSLFLDLDEVEAVSKSLTFFGFNKANVLSFHEADHGSGTSGMLKHWAKAQLENAGIGSTNVKVFILCYPRIFGYVFNPLTIYFCFDTNERLVAFLYEVSNTFGERHTYVMPIDCCNAGTEKNIYRQRCAKTFHVSPFMPMECHYNFKIELADDNLSVSIFEEDEDGLLLFANFTAKASPLSNLSLNRAFLTHPLMTLKVSGSILWEAFRLWRKGLRIYRHQPASEKVAVSIIPPNTNLNQSEKY